MPPATKPAKPPASSSSSSPADAPRRLTLADLSDDDRRALLEQAREASRRNPTDVEGYDDLTPREQAIRGLMDARDHLRGCPVQEGRILGRVEGYDGRRPPNPASGEPESLKAIIRCIECGGTSVHNDPLEELLERAAEAEASGTEPAAAGDETP